MKKHYLTTILLATLLLVFTGQTQPGLAASALQNNLLQNPGFEFPYHDDGAANGWVRWHRESRQDLFDDCTNGYHAKPHWSAETVTAELKRDGNASQHIGNMWRTWAAGVWQNVSVTPGSTYRFSVWAQGFGTNNDYPGPTEHGLQMNIQVGIDPNGSGLWSDGDVVWSNTINPHLVWQQISVEATATGDTLTVFTAADWGIEGVNQCRAHLDVWFDSAELIEVGPPPTNTPVPLPTQPPPPPATNTPVPPTATNTPDIPPTDTPVPTDTPTPTPEGATICVNAFADTNANGQYEDTEGYMGNVTFTIADATQVVAQAVSSGSSTPVCFEGIEPGTYQVAQIVPGRLEMTTAGNTTITAEEGQTIGVEFGSRIRPDNSGSEISVPDEVAAANDATLIPATELPVESGVAPETADPDSGPSLAAMSGLVLLIVAIIMLGVLIFLVLRGKPAE